MTVHLDASVPTFAPMSIREELLRAAVFAYNGDAAAVVRIHRLAPLVEHSVRLQQAIDSEAVFEAYASERTAALEAEIVELRRRVVLADAHAAALDVDAIEPSLEAARCAA